MPRALRLLCVPTTALQTTHVSAPWCAAMRCVPHRAVRLSAVLPLRLLHVVPVPTTVPPPTGLLARLRSRVVDFATGQWQAVQTAESGPKLYVKRCVLLPSLA
jgi:hypothetical protein